MNKKKLSRGNIWKPWAQCPAHNSSSKRLLEWHNGLSQTADAKGVIYIHNCWELPVNPLLLRFLRTVPRPYPPPSPSADSSPDRSHWNHFTSATSLVATLPKAQVTSSINAGGLTEPNMIIWRIKTVYKVSSLLFNTKYANFQRIIFNYF